MTGTRLNFAGLTPSGHRVAAARRRGLESARLGAVPEPRIWVGRELPYEAHSAFPVRIVTKAGQRSYGG